MRSLSKVRRYLLGCACVFAMTSAAQSDDVDGSVTIWFGPKAPAGEETNWVQTMPNKGYNVALRLYGPLEPWFNKTWKPGDPEPVN